MPAGDDATVGGGGAGGLVGAVEAVALHELPASGPDGVGMVRRLTDKGDDFFSRETAIGPQEGGGLLLKVGHPLVWRVLQHLGAALLLEVFSALGLCRGLCRGMCRGHVSSLLGSN